MIALIINNFVVALASVPVGVYLNTDPLYFILEEFLPGDVLSMKLLKIAIRLFIETWCVMEASRSLSLQYLYAATFVNTVLACLKTISGMGPTLQSINCYNELQCINQLAVAGLRIDSAIHMFTGFFVTVYGTCAVVLGWKRLPVAIVVVFCVLTLICWVVICVLVPTLCRCYIYSDNMLKKDWLWKDYKLGGNNKNRKVFQIVPSFRIRARIIKALKPVCWYYGTAMFDEDSFQNYCEQIFYRTVDFVLLENK